MDLIRRATLADASAVTAIYNWYVANTAVTFEEVPISDEAMSARMDEVLAAHDWLVFERDGVVRGYAYATNFHKRAAYRWTTESTVYLQPGHERRGLGKALYRELIQRTFARGRRHLIGVISLPNAASVALHEALGFTKVAHYLRVGFKLGRWIDVGAWQLERTPSAEPTAE